MKVTSYCWSIILTSVVDILGPAAGYFILTKAGM